MLLERKAHADHNFEVCLNLHQRGGAEDWVVTTAFYACLHYTLAALFPFTDRKSKGNPRYKDFVDYCQQKNIERGKHGVKRRLVEKRLPIEVSIAYNRLLDMSYTARYNNYKQSGKTAEWAVRKLKLLRESCEAA